MAPPTRIIRSILVIVALASVVGCAMKVAPDGGPRDTTAPAVVETIPPTGTTGFSDDEIVVRFSKYVDRSVLASIAVQPSIRYKPSYAGDEIVIDLLEPLAANTTYSVTIGTNWADVRGNKPTQAHTIIFATGSSIDSGRLGGKVHAASTDNVAVFCHPMSDDSSYAPRRTPSMYRLPVGTSGAFSFEGLRDGRYRVLAVRDANRNGLADVNEDLGTAQADVNVTSGVATDVAMHLGPARDRVPPVPTRVRAQSTNIVHVTFSERVDSSRVTPTDVTLRDSNGVSYSVEHVWIPSDKRETLILRTVQPLQQERYSLTIRAEAIRDSAGLTMSDTIAPISFTGSVTTYVYRPSITYVNIVDSARRVSTDHRIDVRLSDALRDTSIVACTLLHGPSPIPVTATWSSGTDLHVLPERPLLPSTWYQLRVALGSDTVVTRAFQTAERSDPGAFVATIIDSAQIASTYLLRVIDERGRVVRTRTVRGGDTVTIDNLPAATYTVDAVVDANGNGLFDTGDVDPWTFAERVIPMQARIPVRQRWTVEGVRLVIPM